MTPTRLLALSFLVFALGGCDPAPCVRLSDCPASMTCSVGVCIVPPTDGSTSLDAGRDAGGRDAGPTSDAATDAARPDAPDAP